MNSKPSLVRTIQSDYISTLCLTFLIAAWAFYIGVAVFGYFPATRVSGPTRGTADAPFLLVVALVVTVVCVPLLVWRVGRVWRKLSSGVEVPGRVTNIYFARERGQIEYTYEYGGRRYHRNEAIRRSRRTIGLMSRRDVTVIVDEKNPDKGAIKELYLP